MEGLFANELSRPMQTTVEPLPTRDQDEPVLDEKSE